MSGTQADESSLLSNPSEFPSCKIRSLMHPGDVARDLWLTGAEKHEVLASWASDVHAVPNVPALRQLENGAVVRLDDILAALKSLDEGETVEQTMSEPVRPFARHLSSAFRARLKSVLRRNWPDDDNDPPPCPAMIVGPLGGPLSGGDAVDPGLALAA